LPVPSSLLIYICASSQVSVKHSAPRLADNRLLQCMEKMNDIIMDSREKFKQVILDYYKNIAETQVPFALIDSLSDKVTEYYYEQYSRFRKQYPKSIKRYSTFQLKNTLKTDYKNYSKLLLNLTETELENLEQWWRDFERL
jgi:hypothetical protein